MASAISFQLTSPLRSMMRSSSFCSCRDDQEMGMTAHSQSGRALGRQETASRAMSRELGAAGAARTDTCSTCRESQHFGTEWRKSEDVKAPWSRLAAEDDLFH